MLHASGYITLVSANENEIVVRVGDTFRKRFIPLIRKREDIEFSLTLEQKCTIAYTEEGGILHLLRQGDTDMLLRRWEPARTAAQNDTLRGIERFIAYALIGEKPSDDEVDEVHEAVVEAVMPEVLNKFDGKMHRKRTSDATVPELSRCIEYGLNWLATTDIPDSIVTAMGFGMKKLWEQWYAWRYSRETDPLYDDELLMKWEDYCEVHPVCELCAQPDLDGDPLERMHIVSGGSNIAAYEFPWNWLRAHHSHHAHQHQQGWENITKEFPHIAGKIRRARTMAEGVRRDADDRNEERDQKLDGSGDRSWAQYRIDSEG